MTFTFKRRKGKGEGGCDGEDFIFQTVGLSDTLTFKLKQEKDKKGAKYYGEEVIIMSLKDRG